MTRGLVFLGSVFYFSFVSCVKDKPAVQAPLPVHLSPSKKVYVVNEGNFSSGNSGISLYDPATQQVVQNYFAAQNGSSPGDVAQSLSYYNGSFYLVVNNS